MLLLIHLFMFYCICVLSALEDLICMQFTFKSLKNIRYTELNVFSSIYIIFCDLFFIGTLSTSEIIFLGCIFSWILMYKKCLFNLKSFQTVLTCK
jgi:hypothetical protein